MRNLAPILDILRTTVFLQD